MPSKLCALPGWGKGKFYSNGSKGGCDQLMDIGQLVAR